MYHNAGQSGVAGSNSASGFVSTSYASSRHRLSHGTLPPASRSHSAPFSNTKENGLGKCSRPSWIVPLLRIWRRLVIVRYRVIKCVFVALVLITAARDRYQYYYERRLVDAIPKSCPRERDGTMTIYSCGWDEPRMVSQRALFPEISSSNFRTLTLQDVHCLDERDILVFGMGGPCQIPEHSSVMRSLPLKRVFFSGESKLAPHIGPDQTDGAVYNIGPFPENDATTIQLHYAAMVMHSRLPAAGGHPEYIYDQSRRQRNKGKRFLLYAQSHCVGYRDEAFGALSFLGQVDYSGKCRGNWKKQMKFNVRNAAEFRIGQDSEWERNYDIYQNYRFALTMENVYLEGYITEKIINAFMSGSVPIYYGTRQILDIFNPKAYIFYDVTNPTPALERIAYLERNQTAYDEIFTEPILKEGATTLQRYFSLSDDVGGGKLKARIRKMIGL